MGEGNYAVCCVLRGSVGRASVQRHKFHMSHERVRGCTLGRGFLHSSEQKAKHDAKY